MVKINDLIFGYGQQGLFKGINLEFQPGRIYGFLGKNGAGKTSLFKIICGLLLPQQGTSFVLEHSSAARLPAMLENIFLVPEAFYLPAVSLQTYVDLYAPFYPRFDRNLFAGMLKELELIGNPKLTALSYGQKKKFLLAFGMAANCPVLLLDEPTNGLDIPSKRVLRKQLAAILSPDKTIIIATHQVKEIENVFDSLVIIEQGKILLDSTLDKIARALQCRIVPSLAACPDCIYYEQIPGGYAVISKNDTDAEDKMDIEFLFNAVLNQSSIIGQQIAAGLSTGVSHAGSY
jgi:ABC-2 type transport system ATP-binding protein